MTLIRTLQAAALTAAAAIALAATPALAQTLNGAGATFPAPLYQKWFQEYKDKTHVQINYQGLGSGAGIKAITAHTVDFGASDAPMSAVELAAAPGIVHIPTVAGAVVVAYNVPGIGPGVHLTPDVIADMFLGKISKWNDPRISKLNPGVNFPAVPVNIAHRSDGSGTTNIFTTYLSEVSPAWNSTVHAGKSVNWPKGVGGKGNAGVAAAIQQASGGIGYVELAYAVKNHISYATIRNAKGKFIYPTIQSTTIAVAAIPLPGDFRKVVTNTTAPQGYPITGYTFLLVYPNASPALKGFLTWALTTGQKDAPSLLYAPLPAAVAKRALAKIAALK